MEHVACQIVFHILCRIHAQSALIFTWCKSICCFLCCSAILLQAVETRKRNKSGYCVYVQKEEGVQKELHFVNEINSYTSKNLNTDKPFLETNKTTADSNFHGSQI